jgi:hypothetical protein
VEDAEIGRTVDEGEGERDATCERWLIMMKMKNHIKKFERILIKFQTMGWFSNVDIHVE